MVKKWFHGGKGPLNQGPLRKLKQKPPKKFITSESLIEKNSNKESKNDDKENLLASKMIFKLVLQLFHHSVNLGKSFNISKPQFSHLKTGDKKTCLHYSLV